MTVYYTKFECCCPGQEEWILRRENICSKWSQKLKQLINQKIIKSTVDHTGGYIINEILTDCCVMVCRAQSASSVLVDKEE